MYNTIYNKKVLISPLDWGMGHTSRCIVIINKLLENNCQITIACNKQQQSFYAIELKQNLNKLNFTYLNGYNIWYNSYFFLLAILIQVPKIIYKIVLEFFWLKKYLNTNNYDLVISDNRYGFYNKKITSVIITHQLQVLTPYLQHFINKIAALLLNNFNFIWIPDDPKINLADKLTDNVAVSTHKIFIGFLNRIELNETISISNNKILVILTGPTNAKNTLLNIIEFIALKTNYKFITIGYNCNIKNKQIKNLGALTGNELKKIINAHQFIITRSGYTSLMELLNSTNKKIIVIPTKHQTEQEYLGSIINKKNKNIICISENDIKTKSAIAQMHLHFS